MITYISDGSLNIKTTYGRRGFAGYGLMYLMINEETPRHFIIRSKTLFNKEVIEFARSGKRSKTVELKPSYKSIVMLKDNGYIVNAKTTIKVRMVQVNLRGWRAGDIIDQPL